MNEFLDWLFSTDGFATRRACRGWTDDLNESRNVYDLVTFVSYVGIALVLWCYIRRRHTREFRPIFVMFGLFIVSCGWSHAMEVVCSVWPIYHAAQLVSAMTAAVSMATLLLLIPMTPRAMAIPQVGTLASLLEELTKTNRRLRESVLLLEKKDPALAEEETRRALAEHKRIADRVDRV